VAHRAQHAADAGEVGTLKYVIKPLEWHAEASRTGPWRAVTPFGPISIHKVGTRYSSGGTCFVIVSKQKRLNRSGRRAVPLETLAAAQKAAQSTFEAELGLWLEEAGA
jgi:hypothetical protein